MWYTRLSMHAFYSSIFLLYRDYRDELGQTFLKCYHW
jgi:hypothetical protein